MPIDDGEGAHGAAEQTIQLASMAAVAMLGGTSAVTEETSNSEHSTAASQNSLSKAVADRYGPPETQLNQSSGGVQHSGRHTLKSGGRQNRLPNFIGKST
jgi:hypothetical protein